MGRCYSYSLTTLANCLLVKLYSAYMTASELVSITEHHWCSGVKHPEWASVDFHQEWASVKLKIKTSTKSNNIFLGDFSPQKMLFLEYMLLLRTDPSIMHGLITESCRARVTWIPRLADLLLRFFSVPKVLHFLTYIGLYSFAANIKYHLRQMIMKPTSSQSSGFLYWFGTNRDFQVMIPSRC